MGVYVECVKNPTTTVYNIPVKVAFPADTDPETLAHAVEAVIRLHPELSVHFGHDGSETVQVYEPQQAIHIPIRKMSEEELESYKHEFVLPFNLSEGPLYRMEIIATPEHIYLLNDIHHLLSDGASLDLFLTQLCERMEGKELEAEDMSYAAFAAAEKTAEEGEEYAAASEFFRERLGGCENATEIQPDLLNPVEQGGIGEVAAPIDFESIDAFCRANDITPAHLTLAAVFYALSRFSNSERLCITTVSNGRSNLRIRNTMGMFVNTLALSAQIGSQRVIDFVRETSENFDRTLMHENYPFARIATDFDLSAEIMFAYQMGVMSSYTCNGKELELETLELDIPKFRISFYIQEYQGKPSVYVEYDNGRYSRDLMQSLADSVSLAASAFIREPEALLRKVSLLDPAKSQILDNFNRTEVAYDSSETIVSLFRRQAQQTPDNIALVYQDLRFTYAQVDDITERIAAVVAAKGLGAEDVVSILIPRGKWMLLASLGVLKAGCAYQPLDSTYPAERLNFMMQDAGAKLLITDEELRPIVDEYQGEVLFTKDLEELPKAVAPVPATIRPQDLFILLYTSGTTGKPKGCQIEHRNIVAFCQWYRRYYDLRPGDKVSAYASYGFDACMMDMYPAITSGAACYIIGEDIRLNLPQLNKYFEQEGITHAFMTTQVGCQFAANCTNQSLHHLSTGGEKLPPLVPPSGYRFHNLYGPTECTIVTSVYCVDEYTQNPPIGKPLDNFHLFIVDKDLNRLPLGAAGELLAAGPQVSRGYLNLPEKTAEAYIDWHGQRCYRTGDIVRYLPDGNIQFVGRKDGQVKIRGFRIELKEVEAVIRQYPGVTDATVQAFDYENGGKYIAAYIVSDEQVDIKALNEFIGRQKPPYMIPAATMQIDSIPLNQNQKVNRKALPTPVIQASDHTYVAPANDTERLFADIFAEILSMERIGATDNFFELGGTSLMVTRIIIEADKHGHHVAYGDIFAHPTPRQLAQFITGEIAPTTTSGNSEDANYDYTAIDALLMRNTLSSFLSGERQTIGSVLLTGATGYLGIHVLRELIERSDVPVIWCLIRAENEEKAASRLRGLLYYYYAKNYKELFGKRLRIVLGDVTSFADAALNDPAQPNGQNVNLCNGQINTVFNCAAVVKHFSKGTEIEDVNIGGAVQCVRFCLATGARLIHVSTYSTAGMSVNGKLPRDTELTEQKLFYGQFMDNQYVHSKFISERVVLEGIALHGLNAKIMRVGNLAPRSTDGEFQINFQTNSAMGRIRVFKMLGCYPYEMTDEAMEFSPINEVARAIVLLSETPRDCTLFHPFNNHNVHFGDVLQELRVLGYEQRQVESSEFEAALEAAKANPEKAKLLSSLLAYQDAAHGQEAYEIPTSNRYTTQVLYRLGFHWSPTSWDYVTQFLRTIDGFGYFEV